MFIRMTGCMNGLQRKRCKEEEEEEEERVVVVVFVAVSALRVPFLPFLVGTLEAAELRELDLQSTQMS